VISGVFCIFRVTKKVESYREDINLKPNDLAWISSKIFVPKRNYTIILHRSLKNVFFIITCLEII